MNRIKFVILLLKFLEVLGSNEELNPSDCGHTPMYSSGQITGGTVVAPDEFSWLASLQYGSGNSYGACGGSVINKWYVLTAAHCVTGPEVDQLGGLTGVRLGDFAERPYCDYGTSNCSLYLYFGIRKKIVHEHYTKDNDLTLHNDIALLRLNRKITFDNVLKPVCLPNVNVSEPESNTHLIVAGWGRVDDQNDSPAKRAASIPILTDPTVCEFTHSSRMCAGVLSSKRQDARSSCKGDSGGPLMYQFNRRKMMIEGIVSFMPGGHCINDYFPTHYTRVRHYIMWINANMVARHNSPTSTSVMSRKFPTDCGYTRMEQADNAGNITRPVIYSWLAILKYKLYGNCTCSVINSRYVLTAATCVHRHISQFLGGLTGVRLINFDENGHTCFDSSTNCTHYQDFGIEKIIPHSSFNLWITGYNIALIRVDRPIQFGPITKPICLPFGSNHIPEPSTVDSYLNVGKWYYSEERYYMIFTPMTTDICKKYYSYIDRTLVCVVKVNHNHNKYCPDYGSPLMHQFASQRMVLEGVGSPTFCNDPYLFTRVRSYGEWLNQNMEM